MGHVDGLLAGARARGDLDDFGDDTFREGLECRTTGSASR